ncbi:MAG: hypothetical protein WAQ28_07485 [Bacteroidia bacterium]|jgi:hypothetical protein
MTKLQAILNHTWFFPLLILYYGIAYVFIGEVYYLNEGFSMDGIVFSSFVSIDNFQRSYFFDTYYVHRIFPSLVVGIFFKIFSISITNANIVTGFQVLNAVSIALTCYYIKRILILLKVSFKNQLMAMLLFVLSFSVIKIPYFLPALTDTVAIVLSTAMLFFYLKKNTTGLVVCTILACFTWQMLFYQGIILIAIPFMVLPYSKFKPATKIAIQSASALIALIVCLYEIIVVKAEIQVELVAKINRTLLPLSIGGVVILLYFFSGIVLNSSLFNIRLFFQKLKLKNIIVAALTIVLTTYIVYVLHPAPNKFYPMSNMLTGTVASALIWPLHMLVSHISYWGIVVILLIFFWNDFSKFISQMGWGLVFAFGLNLFTFGIICETRCLANLLPWIIIFLAKAINKHSFSNAFYITIACLSIFASKIWYPLNPSKKYKYFMQLDENGSMGFPDQKLWMHVGPWMSEKMYLIQGAGIILIIILLFFILYRVEFSKEKKLEFVAKYKK